MIAVILNLMAIFFRLNAEPRDGVRVVGCELASTQREVVARARAGGTWRLRKSIKIGVKLISHGRRVAIQMAEVAIIRQMFPEILRLIAELLLKPPPAPA